MNYIGLTIFALTYVGIAIGRFPRLALDRTGIALLGAILMVVTHSVGLNQAISSISFSTLILLFGLMLLSAQYELGGFYNLLALKSTQKEVSPGQFAGLLIFSSGFLSALLSNDVICMALTPVVLDITISRRWNPVPFILALACASNIGSAMTIIGNPQIMFIAQKTNLSFDTYLLWCVPPSIIGLGVVYAWILWKQKTEHTFESSRLHAAVEIEQRNEHWSRYQTGKAVVLTIVLIILFLTPVNRSISVLIIAAILLMSRKLTTRQFLGRVNWSLLVLFIGLFIIIEGFTLSGGMHIIQGFLHSRGIDLYHPLFFGPAAVLLCNMVSNVPAVMLLMADWPFHSPDLAYYLAIMSTYAGNLMLLGSIANLIVIYQAKERGIEISFREHFKWAAPVTITTLVIAAGWWLLMTIFFQ